MLINTVCIFAYFYTREHNAGWLDLPIISSLMAAGSGVLITAALLGQFTHAPDKTAIVYAGLGAYYGMITAIMFIYWLLTTGEILYNKTLGRTL